MGKIIEFKRITVDQIRSIKFIELDSRPIVRIEGEGFTKDFRLGIFVDCMEADELKKLVKFFLSLGLGKDEEALSSFGHLYYDDPIKRPRLLFMLVHRVSSLIAYKQILIGYGIDCSLTDDVYIDPKHGGFDVCTMISDWRGQLRKFCGKQCAADLIRYYNESVPVYHTRLEHEEYIDEVVSA